MEQSRPPKQQSKSAPAPSPSASRTAPAPPQAQTRQAPPPVQQKPAVAPPPVQHKAATPSRVEQPLAQAAQLEHLAITPQAAAGNGPTIDFDWEPAALGTNRSYVCTVTTDDGEGLSVSLAQGMYRRSFDSLEVVKIGAIPAAPAGTQGTLTARNIVTGASASFTWQWQPRTVASEPPPAPPKPAGLLGRLFGRTKPAQAAVPVKTLSAPSVATVAQRLGERSALAVSLKFFGQETVGQRFAFILDMSGSMEGKRWKACAQQAERALRAMPDHVEFFVVLFAHRDVEPPAQSGWMRAERNQVDKVIGWLGRIRPRGGTDPTTAFKRVFSLPSSPDVIYFLTDGELDEDFGPSTCAQLRGDATTIVNTIALENGASADALREMAAASGGQFMLVADASAGDARA